MALRRAILSSKGGWVLKKPPEDFFFKGLERNKWDNSFLDCFKVEP